MGDAILGCRLRLGYGICQVFRPIVGTEEQMMMDINHVHSGVHTQDTLVANIWGKRLRRFGELGYVYALSGARGARLVSRERIRLEKGLG